MRDLLKRGLRLFGGGSDESGTESPEAARRPLYVITLSVSPGPLPLAPPRLPEVGGLTVFRAKRMNGAKELHLQQLGYFDSRPAAEALLRQLERDYPAAMVELAASGAMGSLDDTLTSEFAILRPPESPTLAVPPPAAGEQRYAVQLLRQNAPIDLAKIPRPASIRAYTLYRVQSARNGVQTFGLRLGFFADPAMARLVADSVQAQFPRAALVPVSDREYSRVAEAARKKS